MSFGAANVVFADFFCTSGIVSRGYARKVENEQREKFFSMEEFLGAAKEGEDGVLRIGESEHGYAKSLVEKARALENVFSSVVYILIPKKPFPAIFAFYSACTENYFYFAVAPYSCRAVTHGFPKFKEKKKRLLSTKRIKKVTKKRRT